MLEIIKLNAVPILAALLALSEVLALFPPIKANSIFQMVYNFLKSVAAPKAK